MIEVKKLKKMFNEFDGLNDVDLKLEKNIYGLIGYNGSGKSTLLKLIQGLTFFKDGEITIDGVNIKKSDFNLSKIAYVSAEDDIPKDFDVFSFILMVQRINCDKENKLDYFSNLLHFNLLTRKSISDLSKGEMQKLKLCSVLAYEKEIYFFDEPTSGLDPVAKKNLLNYIKKKLAQKLVIYISHNLDEIVDLCNEVIILKDNKVSNILKVSEKDKFLEYFEEFYEGKKND